jgi:hypothetical protein
VDRIEPGFPMFRTEESVEEDEPGWCPALRRCAGSVRGHVSVRTAAPSGQADWHRASQVSRARSAASQAVTLRGHGDEVSAAGTENRTNEPFSDDGRHACRWWWCRAEGRRRTRTYDWHGTAES